jgi:HSP20 family molecular chaperone IbpA
MAEAVAVREGQNGQQPVKQSAQATRRLVTPLVDVYENADHIFVVADVPGVNREAIDVRVEHDTLTIETNRAGADDAGPALAREYVLADYIRSFRIPAGIDAASVTAEAKNGTLTVRLPKAAAAKTRKVPVTAS